MPMFGRLTAVVAACSLLISAPMAVGQESPDDQGERDSSGLIADQRYGQLSTKELSDVENVRPAVIEQGVTALPAPQPGAEVYPRPADGSYDITGGGFGHGIGMSQYGADGAGRQGLDHREILSFYYPGTRLDTRDLDTIRIGITIDNDGTTRVDHRPGLVVSATPSGPTYPLPPGRTQWRVRATGSGPATCVLEGRRSGTWVASWPSGMPKSCPITFSSATEGSVDLYLPSGELRVYRGGLTAAYSGSGTVQSVNTVDTQRYLWSVVSAEMPRSFHQQALRAQAVAARTYAERGSNGTSFYDTCDTTSCQVYAGRGRRVSSGDIVSTEQTPNKAAVDATDGQVLTYGFSVGRALATTMYSSSNGGWTAQGGAGHGYLRAHADPYDAVASNARHQWTADLPVSSLEARYGIDRLERVQILRRDGDGQWGGRVLEARVEGYTSAGQYTWAYATGSGLRLARSWPYWRTGLSSNYFTFDAPGASIQPVRLAGSNRWGSAAAVAGQWDTGVDVAYVASGQDFPDALSAASRSGVYDAPVLLVDPASVPNRTAAALRDLQPKRIVVVGGTGAVSGPVLTALRSYATTGSVQRVQGEDRYGTAAAMASYYPRGVRRVYLVSGEDYPDALAGAALAANRGEPLLLTTAGSLPPQSRTQLARLDPTEVVVLGGTGAVSAPVAQAAGAYSDGGGFTRLAGKDRYATAAQIGGQFPDSTQRVVVASGQAFPDAIVGAALAAHHSGPLLLTPAGSLARPTGNAMQGWPLTGAYVVGGSGVVQDRVLRAMSSYLR
ncbi:MAG: cell wall-binding repeat-containing protein [Ornithinimicrobium sp.]